MDDTITDHDKIYIPLFRLNTAEGRLAVKLGADQPWMSAKLDVQPGSLTSEEVKDWLKLTPHLVIEAMAARIRADLDKVQEAASKLNEAHQDQVDDLQSRLSEQSARSSVYREFIRNLERAPLVGVHYTDSLKDMLDSAELSYEP